MYKDEDTGKSYHELLEELRAEKEHVTYLRFQAVIQHELRDNMDSMLMDKANEIERLKRELEQAKEQARKNGISYERIKNFICKTYYRIKWKFSSKDDIPF